MEHAKITDPAEIRQLIDGHENWYHQIEVAPGITTPGHHNSKLGLKYLDDLGMPGDLTGKRVLDIGCMDGFFSFAAESRGAEVVGIDYVSPEVSGYSLAHRILGSKARHITANVYDLDPAVHGHFDLVLFLGVLYHLRNPMLALDRIRGLLHDGGALIAETQLATDPAVLRSKTPLWQFYPKEGLHGDATNKWAPNLEGMRAVIEESRFVVVDLEGHGERGYARARAVEDGSLDYFIHLDSSADTLDRL